MSVLREQAPYNRIGQQIQEMFPERAKLASRNCLAGSHPAGLGICLLRHSIPLEIHRCRKSRCDAWLSW